MPIVVPEWLENYYKRGFRLIFYGSGQKGPKGEEGKNWTERSDGPEDFLKWVERFTMPPNVGTFLGHEVSPGRFLADIDFDWPDGLQLSRRLLPKTGFGFGRNSRHISHAFFLTPTPVNSKSFDNIDGKPLVELRGRTTKGQIGMQTMIPPSIHPSGEQVVLRTDEQIGESERLELDVTLYAIGCILFLHLGTRGVLHDVRLAIAGFLLLEGIEEEDVVNLCKALAEVSGNNVQDAEVAVKSTAARVKAHEHVVGRSALAKAIGEEGRKVVGRIKEWLGGEDFVTDTKGKILPNNQDNIRRALEKLDIDLSQDMFINKPFIRYNGYVGPIRDEIYDQAWFDIQKIFHFTPGNEYFSKVVRNVAWQKQYHPVRDYLSSLKWDGKPRLDHWLITYGGAGDSQYTLAVGAIVLIAAVRRVRQPGCKFDELMVLESEQGMLKSSALRALCPSDEWFSDDLPLNVDAKQIIERTSGKWIIEASELKGMASNREVESLKAMLSRQVDGPVRLAYDRYPLEQPRQFIVIGTTNSNMYLRDETGNRRFWPVRINKFDIAGIVKDRDQIWAEAAHRESEGESIRLEERHYDVAGVQQDRRRISDPWEDVLTKKCGPGSGVDRIKFMEVFTCLGLGTDRQDTKAAGRVASIMQKLGYEKMATRFDDEPFPIKAWKLRKPKEDDE
jgi:hypothetical protein